MWFKETKRLTFHNNKKWYSRNAFLYLVYPPRTKSQFLHNKPYKGPFYLSYALLISSLKAKSKVLLPLLFLRKCIHSCVTKILSFINLPLMNALWLVLISLFINLWSLCTRILWDEFTSWFYLLYNIEFISDAPTFILSSNQNLLFTWLFK